MRVYDIEIWKNDKISEEKVASLVVTRLFPGEFAIDDSVPARAREYLKQARETVFAPSASTMAAASAVDAMLKAIGLTEGSLKKRIEDAAASNVITREMAAWAHQIRLDANDQRHADEQSTMPTREDAELCVDFAIALATFLFVLPAKVKRGIEQAEQTTQPRSQ